MRKFCTLAILASLVSSVGCRMCSDCFDHAGPVHAPGYQTEGTHNRAGSAFGSGPVMHDGVIHEGEVIEEDLAPIPVGMPAR